MNIRLAYIKFLVVVTCTFVSVTGVAGQLLSVKTDKTEYCIGDTIKFINNSKGAETHYWASNLGGSLFTKPKIDYWGNFSGYLTSNTYASVVPEKNEKIVFAGNYNSGELIRLVYDSGLLVLKSKDNLGNFGGLTSGKHEGIAFASEGNTKYLFTVNYSKLIRLNFGNSYKNTPSVADLGNSYSMGWAHEIQMFKHKDTWVGVVCNRSSTNQVCILKWENGLSSNPVVKTITTVIGSEAASVCLILEESTGIFYLFYSTVTKGGFHRVKLGTDLFNPTNIVTQYDNIAGVGVARGIKVIRECDSYVGYLTSENGALIRLTFPGGLGGTITQTSITNLSVALGKMEGISNFSIYNDAYIAIMSSPFSGLYRMEINRNSTNKLLASERPTPLQVVASIKGSIPVYYAMNHLSYGQRDTCFTINVINCCKIPHPSVNDITFCKGYHGRLVAKFTPDTGKINYTWYLNNKRISGNNDSVLFVSEAGTYKLIISHGNCKDSCTAIAAKDSVDCCKLAKPSMNNLRFCKGMNGELKAQCSAYDTRLSYKWFKNNKYLAGSNDSLLFVTESGKYKVVVEDITCKDSCYAEVVKDSFKALGLNDTVLCMDEIFIFPYVKNGGYRFWVNDAEQLQGNRYSTSNNAIIKVKTSNDCGADSAMAKVDFIDCDTCSLFLPTAFTPDRNGLNDEYYPYIFCKVVSYDFRIYNRWGEKIFETKTIRQRWDGNVNGKPAQQGVYIAILNTELEHNRIVVRETINQSFHLLR